MGVPLVTVVVPTYNNERTLEACLRSVREQTHPNVELVVVDNHSRDATPLIAAHHADVLLTRGPERSAQRNAGVETASGEWVLWLDSDMVLPPRALELALETASDSGAEALALPERTIGDGFWTRCRALERECYLDDPSLHNPRLLRREHLERDGGFRLDMSGPEDADLRLRLRDEGVAVAVVPVLVDHDEGKLTVRSVLAKRYYYGLSIPAFSRAHGGAVGGQGRGILRSYVRNAGRLARDPLHTGGMVVLRTAEAAAYGWGAWRGRRRVVPR